MINHGTYRKVVIAMKKIFIILGLLMLFCVPSFAASWYWIGGSPSGDQCFIDNSSVIKERSLYAPGTALLWVKINHTDGSYTLEKIKMTQLQKMQIVSFIDYSSDGRVVNSGSYSDYWIDIAPESMGALLYRAVWGD